MRPAAKVFLEAMNYLEKLSVDESHDGGNPQPQELDGRRGNVSEKIFGGATVGVLIQWEAEGALKLSAPTRVRDAQTHDGKEWVFVEGSETGVPMDQVIVEKKGSAMHEIKPPTLPLEQPISRIGTRRKSIHFR